MADKKAGGLKKKRRLPKSGSGKTRYAAQARAYKVHLHGIKRRNGGAVSEAEWALLGKLYPLALVPKGKRVAVESRRAGYKRTK